MRGSERVNYTIGSNGSDRSVFIFLVDEPSESVGKSVNELIFCFGEESRKPSRFQSFLDCTYAYRSPEVFFRKVSKNVFGCVRSRYIVVKISNCGTCSKLNENSNSLTRKIMNGFLIS